MSTEDNYVRLTPAIEEDLLRIMDKKDITPQLLNILRGAIAAHEHAFHNSKLSRQAFLNFMSSAWDAGEHQRKVNAMEVEGSLNNELGVALNLACYLALAMQGKLDGTLS